MSKMMMGQIDHAKKRVAALKREKYGDEVKKAKIKGGVNLLKDLRAGDRSVTGTSICQAFNNYINKVVAPTVNEENGSYRNDYKSTYSIVKKAPGSVEDALASIVYLAANNAEIARWEQETELYKLRKEAIDIKATEVEDAIVLGDQHAALVALQDFTNFEV